MQGSFDVVIAAVARSAREKRKLSLLRCGGGGSYLGRTYMMFQTSSAAWQNLLQATLALKL